MIAATCDHQIVKNASMVIGEKCIALPPWFQSGKINRDEPLERRCRVRAVARFGAHYDLAHMRNIEQTGRCARV